MHVSRWMFCFSKSIAFLLFLLSLTSCSIKLLVLFLQNGSCWSYSRASFARLHWRRGWYRLVGTTAVFWLVSSTNRSSHYTVRIFKQLQRQSISAHQQRKIQDHVFLRSRNSSDMATWRNDFSSLFILRWLVNSSKTHFKYAKILAIVVHDNMKL